MLHKFSRLPPAPFWALFAVLMLVRVPSVMQPAGGDQGLYAYVGERIAHGEIPYRDAWDQKPPAIHYTYAIMFALWPHEAVVPTVDLLVALLIAMLLIECGHALAGAVLAGQFSALLFLFLSNPAFTRLGGVRTHAQCETFIGLAITASLFLLVMGPFATDDGSSLEPSPLTRPRVIMSGLLLGLAVLFKYNAVVYALPIVAAVFVMSALRTRVASSAWLLISAAGVPIVIAIAFFALNGAWNDFYQATVVYNLRYSGETYDGASTFLRYLFTFPIRSARIDSLWFVGGLGSAVISLWLAWKHQPLWIVPIWVAAACLSIAINGSRGLPQYFLQAQPALALAAGIALASVWSSLGKVGRLALLVVLALAIARIAQFDKALDYTLHDMRALTGMITRDQYLARFGGQRETDKFSALAVARLGDYLRVSTWPDDTVLVFGFSGGAYVRAERRSASRFFWSRPIIVGFGEGQPGYGTAGLIDELTRRRPKFIVLQRHDWDPDTMDSATYFLGTPMLSTWLNARYRSVGTEDYYDLWERRSDTE